MFRKLKQLFLITVPVLLGSCSSIFDDIPPCEISLEFRYDYNMEYVCSFKTHVQTIDVFVFDENGKYLFTKHADCAGELLDGNRMSLADDLELKKHYKVLAVGGLSDKFRISDSRSDAEMAGDTDLDDVRLALIRETEVVSHEFPHLWFAGPVDIYYSGTAADRIFPVHLMKNTNKFNLILSSKDNEQANPPATAPYTFEIVTPEGGVYGHDNSPLIRETVTYKPYSLTAGTEPGSLSSARINTVRLFHGDPDGYTLVIRNAGTSEKVWSHDLMEILEETKPDRPDGTKLPMQEYLDRQSEWNIVVIHKGGEGFGTPFLAVAVQVNGWIFWLNDIEV